MDPDQIPALLHYASVLEARDKALRQKLAVQKVMFVRAVGAARLERLGSVFASWKQVHSSQKQMKLILDAERQARVRTALSGERFRYRSCVSPSQEESASLKAQLDAQTLRCKGLEEDLSKNVGITRELLNALNATQQPSLPLEPAMTAQVLSCMVCCCTLHAIHPSPGLCRNRRSLSRSLHWQVCATWCQLSQTPSLPRMRTSTVTMVPLLDTSPSCHTTNRRYAARCVFCLFSND